MVDQIYGDSTLAVLYDRLYPAAHSPDFKFYLPMIMDARSVLDIGCGTGALLHAARAAGHRGRLCGLDPAAAMLSQARARTDIEWVCGDLAAARWQREFDLAVMTGHAFQVFVEDRDLRAALATIGRALTRAGQFAFETRNPAVRFWERWAVGSKDEVRDGDGALVRVERRVEAPFDGRLLSFSETFRCSSWRAPRVSRSTLRFMDASVLASFLAEAGFTIEAQFGDWERGPLTDSSPEIITVARASGSE